MNTKPELELQSHIDVDTGTYVTYLQSNNPSEIGIWQARIHTLIEETELREEVEAIFQRLLQLATQEIDPHE